MKKIYRLTILVKPVKDGIPPLEYSINFTKPELAEDFLKFITQLFAVHGRTILKHTAEVIDVYDEKTTFQEAAEAMAKLKVMKPTEEPRILKPNIILPNNHTLPPTE